MVWVKNKTLYSEISGQSAFQRQALRSIRLDGRPGKAQEDNSPYKALSE
jgi:hypothetical protein